MYKAIIVEDELHAQLSLTKILSKFFETQIDLCGVAKNVEEAKDLIKRKNPNLVFLDIELPDGVGFDVLRESNNEQFHTIFTTAYDHYAIDAIRLGAFDYLVKPISIKLLKESIERLDNKPSQVNLSERVQLLGNDSGERIALPDSDGYRIEKIDNIIRCEAQRNYTKFYTVNNETYLISRTLKEYESLLSNRGFVRVHQSHLVQQKFITRYNKSAGGYLILMDGSEIPISPLKKEAVQELLLK